MTTVRTQSITNGQIGQINDRLATKLRESGLPSDTVQRVLAAPGGEAVNAMFAVFRKHVEAMSEIIIRRARVDRTRTPQEAIDATGRRQFVDEKILATMPIGEGEEVDVWFIPIKRFVPASEVPAFLAQYGLVPDPRAQAAVNEDDPAFADEHPNGTQWDDNCCLSFFGWSDERGVDCSRGGDGWDGYWFLAGVPAPRK